MKSFLTHLECSLCGGRFDDRTAVNVCDCGGSLLARYDLESARREAPRDSFASRPAGQWRFFELMPLREPAALVTLGEGDTPMVEGGRLSRLLGVRQLWIKNEGVNPTGSFKDRGMSAAVSKANELGIKRVGVPTQGNAGSSAAAYGARAGMDVHVFMPRSTPASNLREVGMAGARAYLVDGTIREAAAEMARWKAELGFFDLSTLKEPYRVEGKKVMAYEIAEFFDWKPPNVLVFPTGGGTGVIGMWKAFQEMRAMGWVGDRLPRICVVQSGGCAPLVAAFSKGAERCEPWPEPRTIATGLCVAKPYGDHLVLKAIRESGGAALAVSDDEIRESVGLLAARAGVLACPEGGACIPAIRALQARGVIQADDSVVIFNTAAAQKYFGTESNVDSGGPPR
jgi:threonine synthase